AGSSSTSKSSGLLLIRPPMPGRSPVNSGGVRGSKSIWHLSLACASGWYHPANWFSTLMYDKAMRKIMNTSSPPITSQMQVPRAFQPRPAADEEEPADNQPREARHDKQEDQGASPSGQAKPQRVERRTENAEDEDHTCDDENADDVLRHRPGQLRLQLPAQFL